MATKLVVDLTDQASMGMAIEIISVYFAQDKVETALPQEAQPIVVEEPVVEELTPELVEDDGLGGLEDLMADEPEPTGPTVDDIKAAFKALAGAKGKEGAMEVIQNIFKRINVKKMDEITEDKRPAVIAVLQKAAQA